MSEVYSDWYDLLEVRKLLYKNLDKRMDSYGSYYIGVLDAKLFDEVQESDWKRVRSHDYIPFYAKYKKDYFLRIQVEDNSFIDTTDGHKLAALSTLYEILYNKYGEADVFYTVDDREHTMAFQWCFKDKEQELKKFINKEYFDDDQIKDVILISKEESKDRENFRRETGLPIELSNYVDENIKEFVKYKKGKEIDIPENAKVDGVKVKSLLNK